jgi:NAD(P)-dependent dehydrogenase (short-subunit alcohol dehydrogenase family)
VSDTNRIALVTGANSGIGFEIAKQLLDAGLDVLVGARDASKGAKASARLGLGARAVLIDVTDETSITAATAEVDRLDVLVNNAGINPGGEDISYTSVDQLRRAYETNVFGLVAVTQAFLPALRRSTHPRIVNISSGTGSLTWTGSDNPQFDWRRVKGGGLAYRSSKSAVNAITLLTAQALEADGILVNALAPGLRKTNLITGMTSGATLPRRPRAQCDSPCCPTPVRPASCGPGTAPSPPGDRVLGLDAHAVAHEPGSGRALRGPRLPAVFEGVDQALWSPSESF